MNDDDDDDDLLSLSSSFLLLLKKKYLFNHIFLVSFRQIARTKRKQNKTKSLYQQKNGSKVNQATEFVYENKKICLLYE